MEPCLMDLSKDSGDLNGVGRNCVFTQTITCSLHGRSCTQDLPLSTTAGTEQHCKVGKIYL